MLCVYLNLVKATGFCIGIGTCGGSGEFLAKWVVNGSPEYELPSAYPSRFSKLLTQQNCLELIHKIYLRGTRLLAILPHKLAISKLHLTSRVGLIIVAQLMQHIGLAELVDQQLPASGCNPQLPSRSDIQYFHVAESQFNDLVTI